jgi:hypothetical protein
VAKLLDMHLVRGVVHLCCRVLTVALVVLAPAAAAHAAAPVFGAPTTLGTPSTMTGATAVAVGPGGDRAVVWREQIDAQHETVWGAVRNADATSWGARALHDGANVRGLSVAVTAAGTAVAAWADAANGAVFVAVAAAGSDNFGSPVRVATLADAYSPGVAVVGVARNRAAVIWRGHRAGHAVLYDRAFGAAGAAGPVHALGGQDATVVAASPTSAGALVAFGRTGGGGSAIDALALGRDGARSGPVAGVFAAPAGLHLLHGPRVAAGASGRAVVTWMLFGRGGLVCQSRMVAGHPLHVVAPVARFPSCDGTGASTPTVGVTPDGGFLGAAVSADPPGTVGTGAPTTFVLSGTHTWTGPQTLAATSGWTTTPSLLPTDDGTLAVFARYPEIVGPGPFVIDTAWRPNGGPFQTSTQIGGFAAMDAAGLSAATDGSGDFVVIWPAPSGQVEVVTTD